MVEVPRSFSPLSWSWGWGTLGEMLAPEHPELHWEPQLLVGVELPTVTPVWLLEGGSPASAVPLLCPFAPAWCAAPLIGVHAPRGPAIPCTAL